MFLRHTQFFLSEHRHHQGGQHDGNRADRHHGDGTGLHIAKCPLHVVHIRKEYTKHMQDTHHEPGGKTIMPRRFFVIEHPPAQRRREKPCRCHGYSLRKPRVCVRAPEYGKPSPHAPDHSCQDSCWRAEDQPCTEGSDIPYAHDIPVCSNGELRCGNRQRSEHKAVQNLFFPLGRPAKHRPLMQQIKDCRSKNRAQGSNYKSHISHSSFLKSSISKSPSFRETRASSDCRQESPQDVMKKSRITFAAIARAIASSGRPSCANSTV